MKKPLYLWMVIAIIAMAMTGCEKKKLPVPEEIEIPASSKEVFSAGISFDSGIIEVGPGILECHDHGDQGGGLVGRRTNVRRCG